MMEHDGIVQEVRGSCVFIKIKAESACGACYAKANCQVAEAEDKVIEVPNAGKNYSIGDKVTVLLNESLGWQALWFGYLLPFLLVLSTLILGSIWLSEWQSGLISLIILMPYYGLLYSFRKSLNKRFIFQLLKIYQKLLTMKKKYWKSRILNH